jgi:hypothetical protein
MSLTLPAQHRAIRPPHDDVLSSISIIAPDNDDVLWCRCPSATALRFPASQRVVGQELKPPAPSFLRPTQF